jgi:(p)ppGpp synthase/HD superfamily hydrolase
MLVAPDGDAAMLTDRYKKALQFAADVHEGQVKKGTEIAYLSHLLSVSALVIENDGDEDEAIAGLLHDSVEDRGDTYESRHGATPPTGRGALKHDIGKLFGARVRDLVMHCTDDEYLPEGKPSQKGTPEEWKARKKAYLDKLAKQADTGALRVSCADKLHNARAILVDYETLGDEVWQRFRAKNKADQLWYYRSLAGILTKRAAEAGDVGLKRLAGQLDAVVQAIARHPPG